MSLQDEMDEAEEARTAVLTGQVAWRMLRNWRGMRGKRANRTGAWRAVRDAYGTRGGAYVGPMERLVIAGSVWPLGKDE